jgi:prepilin signal peptidase PulO-like enzyme (type II secretory pathway)
MTNVFENLHDLHVSPAGAWVLVAYAAFLGGAIGSFLNVVAYRLPLGLNLSRPGSRCPSCKHPIRWYHNVPVLGWLVLRGRCYDCGAAISWRYPLVELLVALASGLVCWSALGYAVIEDEPGYTVDLLRVGMRLSLVFLLFCMALLEFDGNRLPLKTFLLSTTLVLVAVALVPQLRPMHDLENPVAALSEMGFPIAASLLLGLLLWPLWLSLVPATMSDACARGLSLLLTGLILGGLGVMFASTVAAALCIPPVALRRFWPPAQRLGWTACLLTATLIWMLVAGASVGSNDTLVVGDTITVVDSPWSLLMDVGIVIVILSLLARAIHAFSKPTLRSAVRE